MSDVLRNVGELASPYYLLELWVRKWEIDLDPETYATLKRKTQRLVRGAAAFDLRGERPDDAWRALRREVIGIEDAAVGAGTLDGGALDVLLAATGDQRARLMVGELDPDTDPDRRDPEAGFEEPPATAFELLLEDADPDVAWGLLLCGLEFRVYRRGTGISQQYLALDIEGLVAVNDEDLWRALAGLFRLPAFRPIADGGPLIQRVCDDSRAHASRLADDMREDVVYAAESLIQGALDHGTNAAILGQDPSHETLQRLFQQSLYVLYRLLFVLYAESRDVLPVREAGPYATSYSLDHLIELARRGVAPTAATTYTADAVRRLFDLLASGPPEAAVRLGVDVLGGELFDQRNTDLFDRLTIGEPAWRDALLALAVGAPGSARARLGRRSSFAELGVDQLGSIYEGLLVLEPTLVTEPSVLIGPTRERRVVPPELIGDKKVLRQLERGAFVLESSSGRRKGSGSFYTPHEITEFLATAALEPLTEPLVQLAVDGSPDDAERELLELRVCDPAMGSGAFLVQAARVLGRALARIRATRRRTGVTPEDLKRAEAEVVRRCIYGVDLNPLAVTLAKVSLWLETLQRGRPLSFLDAHLRVGDSLVGVSLFDGQGGLTLDELLSWPKSADAGLKEYAKKVAGKAGEPMLTALTGRKALKGRRQATLPGMAATEVTAALAEIVAERERVTGVAEAATDLFQLELDAETRFRALERDEESIRNRLREAADVWCAQWFWPSEPDGFDAFDVDPQVGVIIPPGEGDFHAILAHVLDPTRALSEDQRAALEVARVVAAEHHFFHWALEFPEVIVERGGFDAVIGNPPWNTLSPDVKEFFSTYDPVAFRKGTPKATQDARRAELCEDPEIERRWHDEARRLHELGAYVKPKAGRYTWFPEDGQLRKGDANVFRQFVERAYRLLRPHGRLAQVLPDSVYVSSPTTELRRQLLDDGRLDYCFVFENRKELFPIHRSIKIVLLGAEGHAGPTDDFAAAFITGKDAAGKERAIGLPDLPVTLTALSQRAPRMTREQITTLSPQTLAFPELVTPLDAQIAMSIAKRLPPLNLNERGWGLTYCTELHAEKDAASFITETELEELGAVKNGLRWSDRTGKEWWPLVEGVLFYHFEFPAHGKTPNYWVDADWFRTRRDRWSSEGKSVAEYPRFAWRKVASATNERSAVACVLPPGVICKDSSYTVQGGLLDETESLALASLFSSFVFDYLVRFRGRSNLTYVAVNDLPAVSCDALRPVAELAGDLVRRGSVSRTDLGAAWRVARDRAAIDSFVAAAYGLTLREYTAVLATFPLLDRVEPMLPGEAKSFVTRDLALLTFAEQLGQPAPDIVELLEDAGIELPLPTPDLRSLDSRVERYRELGAVPYRPTPRGGRPPTDPALIEAVVHALSEQPESAETIAELVDDEAPTVRKVLQQLVKDHVCLAQGRGKTRSYYLMED